MTILKIVTGAALVGSLCAAPVAAMAAEHQHHDAKSTDPKAKPYPLKTCIVSDEQLGGDMGKPYVFVHEGQEIKLCCKGCLKDFDKAPAKYLKKLADAQKDAKDTKPTEPAHDHGAHQH